MILTSQGKHVFILKTNRERGYLSFESGSRVRASTQDFELGFGVRILGQDFGWDFKSGFRVRISSPFDFSKSLEMQNCVTTQTRLHA